jgi:hypothetical protein
MPCSLSRAALRRAVAPLALAACFAAGPCGAFTTSSAQHWPYAPDAWVRGNDQDRAYFGWDLLEPSGTALGFGQILDDRTPDLGAPLPFVNPRFFQGADGLADPSPTLYGHVSGSGNYYSGFGDADRADNGITATGPGPDGAGFTTLVVQVLGGAPSGQGTQPIDDLAFALQSSGWTLESQLYGTLATGTGLYWVEWTRAGGAAPIDLRLTSANSSRSFDAVQLDVAWTAGDAPLRNALTSIGVPEPSACTLALAAASLACGRSPRRRTSGQNC